MSEPRKLNTGGADSHRSVLDQQQYEQARLRAQQQTAVQGGRRSRRIQTPGTRPQPSAIEQEQAEAEARAREEAARLAPPKPEPPAQPTRAQLQAMELQRAAQQRKARSLHTPGASGNVRELDLSHTQSIRPAYDMNNDAAYEAHRISRQQDGAQPMNRQTRAARQAAVPSAPQQPQPSPQPAPAPTPQQKAAQELYAGIQLEEEQPPKKAPHRAKADKPADGGKPPKPPKKGGDGDGAGPYKGKGNKTKKKMKWWKVLLVTILVIALILGGTLAFIMAAIAPQAGGIKLNQLLNTPKEFQGKELNILVVGIDRSSQKEGDDSNEAEVADGNTDMILYVHFNNETGEMNMLQFPRDIICTTDRSVSGNYRINNVAKTQSATPGAMNIPALCETLSKMYQIPIDGYMTIRLEMLTELVDLFGGIELYVPQEMDYGGSHLNQGYQTLNGDACEFMLRTRKIYPDGDIGRLRTQRQFYSGLFRKLKSIGNIWDVAKLTPAVLNYMETDLSISKLVSFAVSMLKIDSSKIMICTMPVKLADYYNGEAVVYPARQEDADLLNTYFRENTGPVDAAALDLIDSAAQIGFDLSGYTATEPNIQQMGGLMEQDQQAQQNENLDGSHAVEYDVTTEQQDAESQPAA